MALELLYPISPVDASNGPGFVPAAVPGNPLGRMAKLPGQWHGKGFNQIWRPPPAAPPADGETDHTAFAQGGAAGANTCAARISAIFWIERVAATRDEPAFWQLQYPQTVPLNFNGLSGLPVSVATLRKQ